MAGGSETDPVTTRLRAKSKFARSLTSCKPHVPDIKPHMLALRLVPSYTRTQEQAKFAGGNSILPVSTEISLVNVILSNPFAGAVFRFHRITRT